MKGIVCSVCGFIVIEGDAPEKCPVCGSPKKAFQEKEDAIVEPSEQTEKQEANKKHIPQIIVKKACKLIPDGCIDVHVKVGEVTHPMKEEHYIMYIDSYIDKKYISRTYFSPEKMNPATALHLKVKGGKYTAIEKCNVHGAWMSETDI
jgi:superoxide reductase